MTPGMRVVEVVTMLLELPPRRSENNQVLLLMLSSLIRAGDD